MMENPFIRLPSNLNVWTLLSGGKSTGTGTEYQTGSTRFIRAVSGTPAKGCTCAVMNPVPESARDAKRLCATSFFLWKKFIEILALNGFHNHQ